MFYFHDYSKYFNDDHYSQTVSIKHKGFRLAVNQKYNKYVVCITLVQTFPYIKYIHKSKQLRLHVCTYVIAHTENKHLPQPNSSPQPSGALPTAAPLQVSTVLKTQLRN